MALLQISEPGQSPAPHEHRLAVGIDLGTTNSLVATVRSGVATVLPDAQGRALLPSIVRYARNGVDVGYPAQAKQAEDPKALAKLQNDLQADKEGLEKLLAERIDRDQDYPAAAGLVRELQFLEKLEAEIDGAYEMIQ